MKEYVDTFKFDKGLRPYSYNGRNSGYLTQCRNIVPRRGLLTAYEPIVNPIQDPAGYYWPVTMDWPFPQFFSLYGFNWVATRLGIYKLDASFNAAIEVGVDHRSTIWSVADFWDFAVFSNGAMMFIIDPSTGDLHPYLQTDLPAAGAVCGFRGQILLGNASGYDPNMLLWSEIGKASVALVRTNTAGYKPMPFQGAILALKPLGEWVAVYGAGGICFVRPAGDTTPTYATKEYLNFGIKGAGAVCGNDQEHVFVCESGKLWRVTADMKIEELGYEEYVGALGSDLMMSYNSNNRDVYVSDDSASYLLTSEGLCRIYQQVSSAQIYGGSMIGTFFPEANQAVSVLTDKVDFSIRGKKTVDHVEVGCTGTMSFYMKNGSVQTPTVRLNSQGVARLRMMQEDFQFGLAADSFVSLQLEYMNIRWKMTDKRFIRSPYAGQATAGADK